MSTSYRKGHKYSARALEREYSRDRGFPTNVEEVWFAGCHCDVGGGSVANGTPYSLACIPLRWMVRECFKTSCGIMFKTEGLRRLGMDPDTLYPTVLQRPPPLPIGATCIQDIPPSSTTSAIPNPDCSYTPINLPTKSEEEHELLDVLSPIYDQLSLISLWWILEVLPMKHKFQESDDSWTSSFRANMGQGRFIQKQRKVGVKVHRSVKMRMEAEHEDGRKYLPRASFEKALIQGTVAWVE